MQRFPLILGVCLLTCATATAQNAENAAKVAEYYLRTGHPDSAAFYMQLYTQAKKAGDSAGPGPGKEKDKPKKADPLEQLITEALKNNPDIRVAETRLRAAEAEAARARMKLVSELTILHADIEAAAFGVREGEQRYERAKVLYKNKAITAEDLAAAELTYVKVKADLAVLQAKLPYLLGKQTAGAVIVDPSASMGPRIELPISDEEFARRVRMDRLIVAQWQEALKVPASPLTEKLRKALDTTAKLDVEEATPEQVFEIMRDSGMLAGINLVVRAKLKKDRVTIRLGEPVPVGAVLQCVEDELGVTFILREYGIVVVAAGERLPPDAIRVTEFWKHGAPPKTTTTPPLK